MDLQRQRLAVLGNQTALHFFVQERADLAQGLRVGDEDKGCEVALVSPAIKVMRQLLCKRGLVVLLPR